MSKWMDWLTQANDPEARRLIMLALDKLNRLSVLHGHVYMASEVTHEERALDCGHRHYAYIHYRDGVTSCYTCYQPGRGDVPGSI